MIIDSLETLETLEDFKQVLKEIHIELNKIEKKAEYNNSFHTDYFKVLNYYNSVVNKMINLLATDKV